MQLRAKGLSAMAIAHKLSVNCKTVRVILRANGIDTSQIRPAPKPCSVPGCEKRAKSLGYCQHHYHLHHTKTKAKSVKPIRTVIDRDELLMQLKLHAERLDADPAVLMRLLLLDARRAGADFASAWAMALPIVVEHIEDRQDHFNHLWRQVLTETKAGFADGYNRQGPRVPLTMALLDGRPDEVEVETGASVLVLG